MKILPQQIQSIVDLIGSLQDKGSDFIDLLNAIVKVEGLGLTLKRNQAYVMKYVMQDYNKLAFVMDQPREYREQILLLKMDHDKLKYLMSFTELLATCAEVMFSFFTEANHLYCILPFSKILFTIITYYGFVLLMAAECKNAICQLFFFLLSPFALNQWVPMISKLWHELVRTLL